MTALAFTVPGVPAPQGSKTRTKWGIREDNPATRPWRNAVAWEARATYRDQEPLTGPIELHATFYFPRPKSHYGTGKNAAVLKPTAPLYHTAKPDGDKLMRAIGDAITGILIRDDSLIAHGSWTKVYGQPRAHIQISPAEHDSIFEEAIAAA